MIVSLVKFPQMPMSDHGQPKDWKMSQIMSEVPETKLPQQKSDNVRKNVDLNITKIGLYVNNQVGKIEETNAAFELNEKM